uniref:BRCA1 associated ATM activator 1 n=1 Tax=Strix occidentalis caurina TaxID=311401 RepID=A0A8D0EUT7_STROC
MTRECSLLLPRVCAALADPRQPGSDDTCLEKLLDWFRDLTEFGESSLRGLVQDNPCLTEFITSVLALPEPSPSILSFTLRLAGILAASENRFQHLQVSRLLRPVGRCICAKWLGGGCAQHDASPACLVIPQLLCISSIPVCCSDVK